MALAFKTHPVGLLALASLACTQVSANGGSDTMDQPPTHSVRENKSTRHRNLWPPTEAVLTLPNSQWVTVVERSIHAWTPGGAEAWQTQLDGKGPLFTALGAAADSSIFLRDQDFIWCLDTKGQVVWQYRAPLTSVDASFAPVPTTSSEAVVQLEPGKVGVISKAGELLWSENTPGKAPLVSAPSVLANGLIILTTKQWRMALVPLDGRLSWQVPRSRLPH